MLWRSMANQSIQAQPMITRAWEVSDFSGGKTDNYRDGRPNQGKEYQNLLITDNKKIKVRPGSEIQDATYPQIPAGNQRIGQLVSHQDELFIQAGREVYYRSSGWQTLEGPDSNSVLTAGSTANYASFAPWNGHLIVCNDAFSNPMKIYNDGTNWQVRNAGLPKLASTPSVTPSNTNAQTYTYSFIYHYSYTVGSVSFEDFGPVTQVQITDGDAPETNQIDISSIPVLTNGTTDNYDDGVITVKIYRTTNGGTISYYVGEVTNGTTTYADTTSDATISANNIRLYTSGGVLDNDPPPPSKYVVVANDITWYAHIRQAGS